jgi:hypothetical protein
MATLVALKALIARSDSQAVETPARRSSAEKKNMKSRKV